MPSWSTSRRASAACPAIRVPTTTRPPGEPPVTVPGHSWPVFMSFTRGRDQQQRPLFTLKAKLFDSGILDRLTVETGLVTVTADLTALEMRKPPACPRS